jgi:hypothetical protein
MHYVVVSSSRGASLSQGKVRVVRAKKEGDLPIGSIKVREKEEYAHQKTEPTLPCRLKNSP